MTGPTPACSFGDYAQPPRVLGIFAHPDDEVFCAGGTLAAHAAAGSETMVVSATRGEAGQIRDSAIATRRTLGAVREAELQESCSRLGVTRARCLGHPDGSLEHADRSALAAETAAIVDEFDPDVVITFGPDGAYGHPDHRAIGEVTAAVVHGGRRERRLFLSHFPRSRLLLADRLARWLVELPGRFRGEGDFARAFSLFATESRTLGFANDHMQVAWFPPGMCIVEQGEPATELYLILSGRVEVRRDEGGATARRLAVLGPGEFFGELGVIGGTRIADVSALDGVTCLVFAPAAATAFAPRGERSASPSRGGGPEAATDAQASSVVIDVRAQIDRKVAAIAAHRTQYPIDPLAFPQRLVIDMLGKEHYVQSEVG